jgi:ABC-type Mn2+/Zn2+ transport system permease subunit
VIEPFLDNEFLQRALLAGVLVSIACAVVGTYVVLRGLAFIGDALAHGVLPGVAGALLLGWPGMLGAAVGAAAMIGGVGLITTKSRLSSDTAIGLLFVGLLALGVVMVSHSDSFTGDLVTILFGELLGIGMNDLVIQAVATFVVVVIGLLLARPFLLLCFDPDLAQVMGYPSRRYHNVMLALIAATVIVSFQTVGTLLVFGMLLAPGYHPHRPSLSFGRFRLTVRRVARHSLCTATAVDASPSVTVAVVVILTSITSRNCDNRPRTHDVMLEPRAVTSLASFRSYDCLTTAEVRSARFGIGLEGG